MNNHKCASERAFTVLELLITIACLAILAAIIVPAFARAKQRAGRVCCTCHLMQIGLSFRAWAIDHRDRYPMQVSATNGGTMELVSKGTVSAHFQVMSNELSTPRILICPQDRNRKYAPSFSTNFSDSNLSYFVAADATDANPQMFLSGDDNLLLKGAKMARGLVTLRTNLPLAWSAARHVNQGNIALADGSVQQLSNVRLWEAFTNTGVNTNRLLFP